MTDLEIDGRDVPYSRKAGRYLFFALCAFSVGIFAGVLATRFDLQDWVRSIASYAATLATFMALRDMSKNWDRQLIAVSDARDAAREASPKATAAGGKGA